jgi:amino acid permease
MFQSGKALYIGGPVSLWLGYLLMGTVMYSVLVFPCHLQLFDIFIDNGRSLLEK